MTTYMHEAQESNLLGRNNRRSIGSQSACGEVRSVHGVRYTVSTHFDRVRHHRDTLLIATALCIIATLLIITISIAIALAD